MKLGYRGEVVAVNATSFYCPYVPMTIPCIVISVYHIRVQTTVKP